MRCSAYYTINNIIEKTVCILVEKSYLSNLKVVVLLANSDIQEKLNKLLWTYARIQFIPHGSKLDPMAEIQPIYLTHELENPNHANTLILVNSSQHNISANYADYNNYIKAQKFERICLVCDQDTDQVSISKMLLSMDKLGYQTESFSQKADGGWSANTLNH